MQSEQLDELERLLAKATPSPWRHRQTTSWPTGDVVADRVSGPEGVGVVEDVGCENDAMLIATLRNAAPSLIQSARNEARMREALEPFAACCQQIADDESDEEWAKFRLLIKDYRRARAALNPEQEVSDAE